MSRLILEVVGGAPTITKVMTAVAIYFDIALPVEARKSSSAGSCHTVRLNVGLRSGKGKDEQARNAMRLVGHLNDHDLLVKSIAIAEDREDPR